MLFMKLDSVPPIDERSPVRVKECGHVLEIMSRNHVDHTEATTIKLSNDDYFDTRTGEVKQFQHYTSRVDDLKSVSRSLAMGRDMLNTNITDVSHCRWITLTYADNMTDTKKLYNDFKNFNKRCRNQFGHYEYITAAEPQGRGAWHLHCVFIFEGKAPYMANDVVANLWKQGFVTVKKLDNVDNVGAYLTAYLGDMELSEATAHVRENTLSSLSYKDIDITDENGNKVTKRYIKGARLFMYPPKFNIFRYSRGCKKPVVTYTFYADAMKKACGGAQTFSKGVMIADPDSYFMDTLVYEYYNTSRSKSQA